MRTNLGIALALSVVFELRLVYLRANLTIGRDSRIVGIAIGRNISYRELIDAVAVNLLVGFAIDLLLEVRVKEDAGLALLYRREGVLYRTGQLGFAIGCFATHLNIGLDIAVVLLEGIIKDDIAVTIKLRGKLALGTIAIE